MNLAVPFFVLIFLICVVAFWTKQVRETLEEIGKAANDTGKFIYDKPWVTLVALAVFGLFAYWFFTWP